MNTLTLAQAAGLLKMHLEEVRSRANRGLIPAPKHMKGGKPPSALHELGGLESVEMVRRYAHLAAAYYVKTSLSTLQAARAGAVR